MAKRDVQVTAGGSLKNKKKSSGVRARHESQCSAAGWHPYDEQTCQQTARQRGPFLSLCPAVDCQPRPARGTASRQRTDRGWLCIQKKKMVAVVGEHTKRMKCKRKPEVQRRQFTARRRGSSKFLGFSTQLTLSVCNCARAVLGTT